LARDAQDDINIQQPDESTEKAADRSKKGITSDPERRANYYTGQAPDNKQTLVGMSDSTAQRRGRRRRVPAN